MSYRSSPHENQKLSACKEPDWFLFNYFTHYSFFLNWKKVLGFLNGKLCNKCFDFYSKLYTADMMSSN